MATAGHVQTIDLRTNDFEELQEAAEDWDQQYYQMSPGRFEGGIEMTKIGSREIFRERWNRKVRYHGTTPRGTYGLALPLTLLGTANWIGEPVAQNTVVLQAPGNEAEFASSDTWDALTFAVAEEEVEKISSALSDRPYASSDFHGSATLSQNAANSLRSQGMEFLRCSKSAQIADATQVALWSEQFVRLFLWEVIQAQQDREIVVVPARSAEIVKQATDLVLSEPGCGTGLTEICERIDVSLRTLHYAFQDVTGMSPATWLRRMRLNQAHKTLARSAPDEVLVKQVALDNGFLHFGHFGTQYRRMFGCSPSQTLER